MSARRPLLLAAWDALLSHAAGAAAALLLSLSATVSFLALARASGMTGSTLSLLALSVVWAFFGFGAFLAERRWARRATLLCGAAAAVLASWAATLTAAPATLIPAALAASAFAAAAMALLGALAAQALREAVRLTRVGAVVAAACVGAVLGMGLAFLSMRHLGAGASLLALVALCAASALRPLLGPLAVLLAFLACAPRLPALEARIESLRATPYHPPLMKELFPGPWKRALLYWDGSGKFEEFEAGDARLLHYNNRIMTGWMTGAATFPDISRRRLFLDFKQGERALLIGVSAASGLRDWVTKPGLGLTLVDINAAVVRAYTDHPERNWGAYLHSRVLARDGRSVLEASPEASYDAVVYDFADSASMLLGAPGQHLSLATREGLDALERALKPRGRVVFLTRDKLQSLEFAGGLARRGWSVRLYAFPKLSGVSPFSSAQFTAHAVLAARPGAPPPASIRGLEVTEVPRERFLPPRNDGYGYGYPRVFRWTRAVMPRSAHRLYWSVQAAIIALALLLTAAALPASPLGRALAAEELYFLRVGAACMTVQMTVLHLLKPLLGETLLTSVTVNTALNAFASLAALAAARAPWPRRTAALALLTAAAAGLAVTLPLLRGLRLTGPGLDIPWTGLLLAAAPLGLAAGLCFPTGLVLLRPRSLGRALAADAAGALGGHALCFVLLTQFGARSLPWACLAFFAAACGGLYSSRPGERAR